jgi:hypothetical protein
MPKSASMHPAEFNKLTLASQIQWLYLEGEFVMDIRYYHYKINLYLLKGFYVEVFFHHKEDRIKKIKVLDKKSTRMKFYADQVQLPGIKE